MTCRHICMLITPLTIKKTKIMNSGNYVLYVLANVCFICYSASSSK